MKEATGDLNMTVIIVMIVAALVVFFSVYITPLVLNGIKSESNCSNAICPCKSMTADNGACTDCYICENKNGGTCKKSQPFRCPYKG